MINSSSNIRIIPSLLLKDKRLVKGKKFSNFVDAGDPVKTCVAHDSQLCDEISIVDINAYHNNKEPNIEILKSISKELTSPILYGGNINNFKTVEKLIRNGADKIIINSNIFNKELTKEIINSFGKQSLVGGLDLISIDGKYKIYSRGNIIKMNYSDYLKKMIDQDIGELKVTFVNLEGTRKGLDIDTSMKIIKSVEVPVIIEGGTKNLIDLENAIKQGINSIALGNILIFSDNNIFKVKQFLENRKINVRIRN
tara:strand:- start:64 stop:825 length:762 start_codon:yes stop_codon:yes gene_type:complete